jgi:hypothetical protein
MAFVDYEYYKNTYGGTRMTASEAPGALQAASNAIDSITYCRIGSDDLGALTGFQKKLVQEATCALAEWQIENADMLDTPYSSYSINGVAAAWGKSAGVRQINGILIPSRIYAELIKTGLCYPGVR